MLKYCLDDGEHCIFIQQTEKIHCKYNHSFDSESIEINDINVDTCCSVFPIQILLVSLQKAAVRH